LEALPQLYVPGIPRIPPTPPLVPSGLSDTDSDDDDPDNLARSGKHVTLRALTTETKTLYRDVIQFSSSPRVVDLSVLNARRNESKSGRGWMPKKKTPAAQVLERKMQAEKLSRRVQGLLERASALGGRL